MSESEGTVPALVLRDLLGAGGMGEVRRAWDPVLERDVAVKILKADLARRADLVERFEEEARLAGQLQHPGVLGVYALGQLADGRPCFTMPEVHGPRLTDLVARVHAVRTDSEWPPTADGWTLRRLIEVVHRVCQAMAYAHERGVIHRDLKPDNVMVGDHGEVWVLDWGLARGPDTQDRPGMVAGTPEYMAPEQARGATEAHGPPTDVHALGATLFHVLTGSPPYADRPQAEILDALAGESSEERTAALTVLDLFAVDPPTWHDRGDPRPLPGGLREICSRATHRDPARRHPSAAELASALGDWLSGAVQREEADRRVADAEALAPRVDMLRAESLGLRERAARMLEGLHPAAPVSDKRDAWALEDRATALLSEADHLETRIDRILEMALQLAPDHTGAHRALANRLLERHRQAEASGSPDAPRVAASLEVHALALRPTDPLRAQLLAWLDGRGTLTLPVDPPQATLIIERYVEKDRRLTPVRVVGPVPGPLQREPFEMGSYRIQARAPGRHPVVTTVRIGRTEHVAPFAPDAAEPTPLWLPPLGSLGQDDCYVPAGWFQAGGDPDAVDSLPAHAVWVDGFVLRRHPVTNGEYLAFLDHTLRARGRDAAHAHVPRTPGSDEALYAFDGEQFSLGADREGHHWHADYPVVLVDWHSAMAYAAWEAERTGLAWRLPMELEWEKAARGADGRTLPWGDHFDASWCWVGESHRGPRLPARIGDNPEDRSPYGVVGMAGNVRDWCLDGPPDLRTDRVEVAPSTHPQLRYARGGTFVSRSAYARSALRTRQHVDSRAEYVGIRLARSLGPED